MTYIEVSSERARDGRQTRALGGWRLNSAATTHSSRTTLAGAWTLLAAGPLTASRWSH